MSFIKILLSFLLLFGISCSKQIDNVTLSEKTEVLIGATINNDDILTRTSIDESPDITEAAISWNKDDKIYVWASKGEESTFVFENQEFGLRYYGTTYDKATFTSTINPMSEEEHTYFAVYPKPTSSDNTFATFTIPAEQNGKYNDNYDIMVAVPDKAEGLSVRPKDDLNLNFKHLTHIFKIQIPEGRNLLNEAITRLKITFPTNIVGDKKVNFRNISEISELSNASKIVTLVFENPILDNEYIWLFVNPTVLNGEVKFEALNNVNAAKPITTVIDKELLAGHITPITLTIPTVNLVSTISLKVTGNNLGEEISNVIMEAPAGGKFENGASTVTIPYNSDNIYEASFDATGANATAFNNSEVKVYYDSPHAKVAGSNIKTSTIVPGSSKIFEDIVPYLLFEDFNTIKEFSSNDNAGVGGTALNGGDKDAIDLSAQGLASGWTAARVGSGGVIVKEGETEGNGAIRIACRYQSGGSIATTVDDGRIDSPSLSGLKSNTKVKVTYNYKGGRYSMYNSWGWKNGGNGNTLYTYGYTTKQGGVNSGISLGDSDNDATGIKVGDNITLPNTAGDDSSSTQDYNGITNNGAFYIDSATSQTRITWTVTTSFSRTDFFGVNGNFWLYLDNVIVQIAE